MNAAAWATTRRLLLRRERSPSRDRGQARWADRGSDPDVVSAPRDRAGLRRPPGRLSATPRAWASVGTVPLTKAGSDWRVEARRVRAVVRGVWRASRVVGCVNSVARRPPARHRPMTPGLGDLKRLDWDLHRFRVGRRKGRTPSGLLGLELPDLSSWEFPKLTPEELREELSAQEDVA